MRIAKTAYVQSKAFFMCLNVRKMSYTLDDYKRLEASPRTQAYKQALKRVYESDNDAILLDLGTGSVMCFSKIGEKLGFKTCVAIEKCTNAYNHAKRYYLPKFKNTTTLENMDVLDLTTKHFQSFVDKRFVVVHEFFDNLASAENAHILLEHVSQIFSSLGISASYVPCAASTTITLTHMSFDTIKKIQCEDPRLFVPFCMIDTGIDCIDHIEDMCAECPQHILEKIDFVNGTHECPVVNINDACKHIVFRLCIHFDEKDYTISDGDTWQHLVLSCDNIMFPLQLQLEVKGYSEDHPIYALHLNKECIELSNMRSWSHLND